MHKRPYLFLLCFLAFAVVGVAQDDGFYWVNNYRDAIRQANETHKPIFLEFRCEA